MEETSPDSKAVPVVPVRLDKPLVVPRVLSQPQRGTKYGKPFVRAYSPALQTYGISEEELLAFIDELNMKKRGNPIWGKGISIRLVATLAALNSACGPYSNKVGYLRKANRELFGPKGLRARVLNAKELRTYLGMAPNTDLALPMDDQRLKGVPTKEELMAGKRAPIRSAHRQIFAMKGRVAETNLAAEADVAWTMERNSGRKLARRTIRDLQVLGEIVMELQRGKMLQLRDKALAQPTESKKQKGLKSARKADWELKVANRNQWLVIEQAH
ncbi:histone H3 K4-specific methyltransferase SET7/9 N-terminal domain-containing protein [Mycena sanguinolenta]|uniref:Histone H3 K4-specific methyltransferase SET7/9 N-terminal domain-containing protein n=1 Tax=Mycena sanguinolenta TaxID=230812 RepID=A0A8H7CY09_9AGAR|nr:histone H3 K4-specific methyltransferase SET7/9 N-terminal domain-containing protein [Mycena sanguinolenta]